MEKPYIRAYNKRRLMWNSYDRILFIFLISSFCFANNNCKDSLSILNPLDVIFEPKLTLRDLMQDRVKVEEAPPGSYIITTSDEVIRYSRVSSGGFKVKRYIIDKNGKLTLVSESFSNEPPISTKLIREINVKLTELRKYVKKYIDNGVLTEEMLKKTKEEISSALPLLKGFEKEETIVYVAFIRSQKVLDVAKKIYKNYFESQANGKDVFKQLLLGEKRWEETITTEEENIFVECLLGSLNILRKRGYNQFVDPVVKKLLTDLLGE